MVSIDALNGLKGHNVAILRFRRRFSDKNEHIASVVQLSAPPPVDMEANALPSPVAAM